MIPLSRAASTNAPRLRSGALCFRVCQPARLHQTSPIPKRLIRHDVLDLAIRHRDAEVRRGIDFQENGLRHILRLNVNVNGDRPYRDFSPERFGQPQQQLCADGSPADEPLAVHMHNCWFISEPGLQVNDESNHVFCFDPAERIFPFVFFHSSLLPQRL